MPGVDVTWLHHQGQPLTLAQSPQASRYHPGRVDFKKFKKTHKTNVTPSHTTLKPT